MKRHFIYLLTGLVLAGSSAQAQDGVIRVIQPDGTVQEAQIPARKAPVEPQTAPVAAPAPAPVIEPAPMPPQAVSPADLAVSAPKKVEAPAEKPVEKSAKKAKPVKAVKPKKDPKPPEASKPIPAPDALGKVMTPPRPVPQIAPGAYITKAQALEIALDYAPPAKSYDVLPRTYKDGRFIYVVQFATEDGPRDILIDAKDGAVINKAR